MPSFGEKQIVTVARWTARIIGTLLLLPIAAFAAFAAFGQGDPNLRNIPLQGILLLVALPTSFIGLVVAWKWEGVGALLILVGSVLFYIWLVQFPFILALLPMLLTGLLYLLCWESELSWRRKAK